MVKTIEQFDIYLAVKAAQGEFIRVRYRLFGVSQGEITIGSFVSRN